jgi:chromosome segregation ATPase
LYNSICSLSKSHQSFSAALVNERYTTKRSACCRAPVHFAKHNEDSQPLNQSKRTVHCVKCKKTINRDSNGACNIARKGIHYALELEHETKEYHAYTDEEDKQMEEWNIKRKEKTAERKEQNKAKQRTNRQAKKKQEKAEELNKESEEVQQLINKKKEKDEEMEKLKLQTESLRLQMERIRMQMEAEMERLTVQMEELRTESSDLSIQITAATATAALANLNLNQH